MGPRWGREDVSEALFLCNAQTAPRRELNHLVSMQYKTQLATTVTPM